MFCKSCGHEVKEGAAFCQYCGKEIAQVAKAPEPAKDKPKNYTGVLIAGIVACIVLIIALIAFLRVTKPTPDSVPANTTQEQQAAPADSGNGASQGGAGQGGSAQDSAVQEQADKKAATMTAAADAYRKIISNPSDAFDADTSKPADGYVYTLIKVKTSKVPLLAIKAKNVQSASGCDVANVYTFDTEKSKAVKTDYSFIEGVAAAGGFRGSTSASKKKNGLISVSFSSGTGEVIYTRTTFNGKKSKTVTIAEGTLGSETSSTKKVAKEMKEISWSSVKNDSKLDKMAS